MAGRPTPPPLPAKRTPQRPSSARARFLGEGGGTDNGFRTLDISLHNQSRHVHDKLYFDSLQASREDPVVEPLNSALKGFLYSFQEKLLAAMRTELREEESRLRNFLKATIKEAKDELQTEFTPLMQTSSQVASKILGAVWEVLEEVKGNKEQMKPSDVLRAIRESREPLESLGLSQVLACVEEIKKRLEPLGSQGAEEQLQLSDVLRVVRENRTTVDLSEVLSSMDDIKRRLEPPHEVERIGTGKMEAELSEILATVKDMTAGVKNSDVLAAVRESRAQSDVAELARAVREGHSQRALDLSELSAVLRETRQPADLSRVLTAVERSQADVSQLAAAVQGGLGEAGVQRILVAVERVRAEVDLSPVLRAVEAQAAVAEGTAAAASSTNRELSGLLNAVREQKEEVLEAVRRLSGPNADVAGLPGLLDALRNQNAEVLRVVGGPPSPSAELAGLPGLLEALRSQNAEVLRVVGGRPSPSAELAGLPGLLEGLRTQNAEVLRAVGDLPSPNAELAGLRIAVNKQREELLQALAGTAARPNAELSGLLGSTREAQERLLEALGGLKELAGKQDLSAATLNQVRDEAGRLADSRAKLAEAMRAQEERHAEGEQDLRRGLEAIRDLRRSVVLDMQPVVDGLDHNEVRLVRLGEELKAMMHSQHLEVVNFVQQLLQASSRSAKRPDWRPVSPGRPVSPSHAH